MAETLSTQGSIHGHVSSGDAVLRENVSLDTGDQSNEEAKGPAVPNMPWKLISGENMLNGRLCVRQGVYVESIKLPQKHDEVLCLP